MNIVSAVMMGLAVGLLVWGGRAWILRRYHKDVDWVRDSLLRFHPTADHAERLTIGSYVLLVVLLGVLVFVTPHPLIALALWLVLLTLPRIVVEVLWHRRREKIDQQIPVAVAAMANSLRAGLTLMQAMERLAESAPEPIRTDFQVMVNRYSCGVSLESTIRETKQRLKLANFNLFASAMLINREMGGDAAETLTRISQSLDKLQQMRKTVEAHTSEGRTNVKVLMVAPVLLLLMMSTADPEGVKMLFTTPPGYAVLLVAGVLMGTGMYFAARITRSEI